MAEPVRIGHVIVPCPRCEQPRHVPIAARTVPLATRKSWVIRALLGARQMGQIHIEVSALPDSHVCGQRPGPGLLVVSPVDTTDWKKDADAMLGRGLHADGCCAEDTTGEVKQ